MESQAAKVLSEEERRKLSQILGEPVMAEQNMVKPERPVAQQNPLNPQNQEPSLRNLAYVFIVILILIAALVKGYFYVAEQTRIALQTIPPNIPPSPTSIIVSPTTESTPDASKPLQP